MNAQVMPIRCQHLSEHPDLQCSLNNGHDGPHKSVAALDFERRRNLAPTLDDIRQVVREEIRRAHQEGA